MRFLLLYLVRKGRKVGDEIPVVGPVVVVSAACLGTGLRTPRARLRYSER
jgi:hypothetical protein